MKPRHRTPAPHSVTELEVELAAVLARGAFRLDELDRLRPGDVLQFRHRHDAPLELVLNGRTVGTGRAVERDERLGILLDAVNTGERLLDAGGPRS